MKVSDLVAPQLDLWVARALAQEDEVAATYYGGAWIDGDAQVYLASPGYGNLSDYRKTRFTPSSTHAQGGPIMDHFKIDVLYHDNGTVSAILVLKQPHSQTGPTRLIAGMRALVASIFGHEVPD
jgi:hypothetical protein